MNCKLFNKIVIWIAIIALSVTPIVYFVYFVGIGAIWTKVTAEANPITATATFVLALTSIIATIVGLSTYYKQNKKSSDEKKDKDKHDKVAVQPLLEFDGYIGEGDVQDNNKNSKFEVTLVNRGVGPAIIKSFVLKIDGKEKSRNNSKKYYDSLEKLLKGFKPLMISHRSSGSAVQVGEKIVVLRFKYNAREDNIDFINKVEILVKYQSIYKDKIIPAKYKNEHRLDRTEF